MLIEVFHSCVYGVLNELFFELLRSFRKLSIARLHFEHNPTLLVYYPLTFGFNTGDDYYYCCDNEEHYKDDYSDYNFYATEFGTTRVIAAVVVAAALALAVATP